VKRFYYEARDRKGERLNGEIMAQDEHDLVVKFQREHKSLITIRSLEPDDEEGPVSLAAHDMRQSMRILFRQKVSDQSVLLFTQQLSAMLDAGVTLKTGIRAIFMGEKNERFKLLLTGIIRAIEEGMSLQRAFGQFPEAFNKVYANLIRVGTVSGELPLILRRHAIDLEKLYTFKQRLASTLTYPATIFSSALVFMVLIVIYFVPRFSSIYKETNAELPWITSALVFLVNCLVNPIVLGLIIMGGLSLFLMIYYYVLTPVGRYNFDYVTLKIPFLGGFIFQKELYQFCVNLATMLECGVPIVDALLVLKDMTCNEMVKMLIDNIIDGIKEGQNLSDMMRNIQIIPRFAVDMIHVGEITSDLTFMLRKTAEILECNVNQKIEMFLKLIEPLIMGLLAVLAGIVLIATFLPLYGVINRFTL
jgi:type IV pilus assembly protein PilC